MITMYFEAYEFGILKYVPEKNDYVLLKIEFDSVKLIMRYQ